MGRPHIEFIQAQALKWAKGLPAGTGRADVECKTLSIDDATGTATCIVRYPAGWTRPTGEYLTTDEEFYVLEGALTINGVDYAVSGELAGPVVSTGKDVWALASRAGLRHAVADLTEGHELNHELDASCFGKRRSNRLQGLDLAFVSPDEQRFHGLFSCGGCFLFGHGGRGFLRGCFGGWRSGCVTRSVRVTVASARAREECKHCKQRKQHRRSFGHGFPPSGRALSLAA